MPHGLTGLGLVGDWLAGLELAGDWMAGYGLSFQDSLALITEIKITPTLTFVTLHIVTVCGI